MSSRMVFAPRTTGMPSRETYSMNSASVRLENSAARPQRQALVLVERHRQRQANAWFGEQRIVAEVYQQCLRLMAVKNHHRVLARIPQRDGWVAPQLSYADRFHHDA